MHANINKYLFVIGSLKKGGAERNLAITASFMADIGHEVHVLLFERIIDFELHPGIIVHAVGIPNSNTRWSKAFTLFIRVFLKAWTVRPKYVIGFTRLASQLLAATLYPRVIARYDIYPLYMKKRRWVTSVLLFNLPNVRKIVCPSKELVGIMSRYFINDKKLTCIYNPVAQTSYQKNVVQDFEYFIVVGRLSHQKCVHHVIHAFNDSRVKDRFKLLIVGDGKESTNLLQLVKNYGLQDRVQFLGFVNNPYELMANAKALILSSKREGFPNVLVESLSLGTPVISTKCLTGPSEIVQDGYNGILYEVGDVEGLTKSIDLFGENESFVRMIKANAKVSVGKFNYKEIMKEWNIILT